MRFEQLFEINSEGMISPRTRVKLGPATFGPGTAMGGGVVIGGVRLADLVGKELQVKQLADGTIEVVGYRR